MSKCFSQLDKRWAGLPYPKKPFTIGTSGCGCCSIANLLVETEKYKKYTPKTIQPYMKQFAVAGQGTTWTGITEALKHYGLKPINHKTMDDVFKTLSKRKKKWGIILFRKGTRGGVTWTTSGHYVAFTDYKTSHGRHYFYTKDSGGRNHTGWYCYETQMMGLIPQIWTAEAPIEKKKAAKKTSNAKKIADMADKLAYKTAPDKARYPNGKPTPEYKKALDKAYPNRKTWGTPSKKGASCDVFAGTVIRSSGVDKKFPRCLSQQDKYLSKSKKFERVKNPTVKKLKDGDIIIYQKREGGGHICIFAKGKIKHAAYKRWYGRTTNNEAKMLSTKGRKFVHVYRAN